MKEAYMGFGSDLKAQVKKEQGNQCAWCGRVGCVMQVHHIVPSSMALEIGMTEEQTVSRENAVALCKGKDKCHDTFDTLALKYNTFFDEVMMNEGKEYPIKPKPKHRPQRNLDQIQIRDIVRFVNR